MHLEKHLALKEKVDSLKNRVGLLEEVVCPYGRFGIDIDELDECSEICPPHKWKACAIANDNMRDNTICSNLD